MKTLRAWTVVEKKTGRIIEDFLCHIHRDRRNAECDRKLQRDAVDLAVVRVDIVKGR